MKKNNENPIKNELLKRMKKFIELAKGEEVEFYLSKRSDEYSKRLMIRIKNLEVDEEVRIINPLNALLVCFDEIDYDNEKWIEKLEKKLKDLGIKVENNIPNNIFGINKEFKQELKEQLLSTTTNDFINCLKEKLEGNWNSKINSVDLILENKEKNVYKEIENLIRNNNILEIINKENYLNNSSEKMYRLSINLIKYTNNKKIKDGELNSELFKKLMFLVENVNLNSLKTLFKIRYANSNSLAYEYEFKDINKIIDERANERTNHFSKLKRANKLCHLLVKHGYFAQVDLYNDFSFSISPSSLGSLKLNGKEIYFILEWEFSNEKFSVKTINNNYRFKDLDRLENDFKNAKKVLESISDEGFDEFL